MFAGFMRCRKLPEMNRVVFFTYDSESVLVDCVRQLFWRLNYLFWITGSDKCFMCMFVIIFFFLTDSVWCNWAEIIRNSCSCSCIIGFSSVPWFVDVINRFHDCHYWFYCGKPGGRDEISTRISFFRFKWWVVSKKLLFKQVFAPQVLNAKLI